MATTEKTKTTEKSTEELAREYFAAAANRNVEEMVSKWAPGGFAYIYGMAELEVPVGYRDYFENLFAAFPDFRFEVLDVIAADNRAAVRWRGTGAFNGEARFQGLVPNGARAEIEACDLLTFNEEGLAIENRAYVNGADIAQKLGALPPAGSLAERGMIGAMNLKTAALEWINRRR
jgi:predicted ester cyclase